MITFQRELDGGSRRTVRREKLPVKEDRKWSLEANDNWPGGQAHSRHASGQACAQNFDVVVKGGEGKKCFTSVMRDTRGRKLKLPSVSPSGFFLPLSPRPWQIYYRQTLAPLRPPNDQPELLSFSSRRRKRDHLAGDWFSTVENLLFQ